MGVVLARPTTTSAFPTGDEEVLAHPRVGLKLDASAIKDLVVAIKLAQSLLLLVNMEMANKIELDEVTTQF